MCAVHKQECIFWPAFEKQRNPKENLLVQLQDFSGDNCFVVNNPRTDVGKAIIDNARVHVTEFSIQRDLRALAASFMRKNPDSDIVNTHEAWLLTAANTMFEDVKRKDVHLIKFEDVTKHPENLIAVLSEGTGLKYKIQHLHFWEHESHVVTGNAGTVGTIRSYHDMNNNHKQEFYNQYLETIRKGGEIKFKDERWRKELDRYDLFVIDQCVGELNEKMGYERDQFSDAEIQDYSSKFQIRLTNADFKRVSDLVATSDNNLTLNRTIDFVKRRLNQLLKSIQP